MKCAAAAAMVETAPDRKHLNWLWDRSTTLAEHRSHQQELRERLAEGNGISGLEVLQPDELTTEQLREKTRALFVRDGFVCVDRVLQGEKLAAMRAKALRVIDEIVELDKFGGAKGMWQYSFGGW